MPSLSPTLKARLDGGGLLLALTGAGVSAESGLATFRGPGGIWEGRDPMELATPQAFEADPATVWRFYAWRRKQAAGAEPNPAHLALAALENRREEFLLVTQNVDGLHERSGSRRIVRMHGSLWRSRCTGCDHEFDDLRFEFDELPPRHDCGGSIRPAVVWFGESLSPSVIEQAEAAARNASLVLVAGTSSLVYPAAGLPLVARAAGAYVVEINPQRTPLTDSADEHLAGPAGEILPALAEAGGCGADS